MNAFSAVLCRIHAKAGREKLLLGARATGDEMLIANRDSLSTRMIRQFNLLAVGLAAREKRESTGLVNADRVTCAAYPAGDGLEADRSAFPKGRPRGFVALHASLGHVEVSVRNTVESVNKVLQHFLRVHESLLASGGFLFSLTSGQPSQFLLGSGSERSE